MSPTTAYTPMRSPRHLLASARSDLVEAGRTHLPAERYALAHLSALRAAAAVLSARPVDPASPRRAARPTSVWRLLPDAAPELTQWSAFFAATAAKRQAAEAGVLTAADATEADDLMRAAQTFVAVVETTLGIAPAEPLLRAVG